MAGWLIKKNGVSFSSTSDVSLEYTINIGSNGGDSDDVYSVVYTDSNGCVSDELEYRVTSCSSCDCLDIISSSSINFPASGGSIVVASKVSDDCSVSTSSRLPNWLSVISTGSDVVFSARTNSTTSSRSSNVNLIVGDLIEYEDCGVFSVSQADCNSLPNYLSVSDFSINCNSGSIRIGVGLYRKSDDSLIRLLSDDEVNGAFSISPNPVDNTGVSTTYVCSLSGYSFSACDLRWEYRACESMCYNVGWDESVGVKYEGFDVPELVSTSVRSNTLVIKNGSTDITSECSDIKWFINYLNFSGEFVDGSGNDWREILSIGSHGTGEGLCTGSVVTVSDDSRSGWVNVQDINSISITFTKDAPCQNHNEYMYFHVGGSYFTIGGVKFKYSGQDYVIMGEGDGSYGCLRN